MMGSIVSYKIQISKSVEELSEKFALLLIDKVNNSNDFFHLVLSGGTTPKIIFEYLTENHQNTIFWNKVKFYWGDERCVPPTDSDSNYKMATDFLLSRLQISEENIIRIKGENDPQLEAENYSSEILKQIKLKKNGIKT